MTFVYVSGQGTDSTEQGRAMWARVRGRTENALRRVGFRAVYLLRPGLIVPLDGIRSRTWWYRALYAAMGPALPLLERHQGLGLGAALMRAAEREAAAGWGARAVRLDALADNAALLAFYARLGYAARGRRAHDGWTFACLERRLP